MNMWQLLTNMLYKLPRRVMTLQKGPSHLLATIDYILEEVNSLPLPMCPLRPSPVKRKGKKQPSPDLDAITDYILEEVDSLPLPLLH